MKKIAIIFTVLFLFITSSIKANVNWITSYEDALTTARVMNKPILVDFWAIWCGPCKKMDDDVWTKEEIQDLMGNFVNLKIDIDIYTTIASKYGVRGIPNVFIIDGWGNVLYSQMGYQDKNAISKLLTSFSLNMSPIYQALNILEQDEENVYSNLRVGQIYQDVGYLVEGEARKAFLKESNDYLKTTLKLIQDKPVLEEKAELLLVLTKAYRGGEKSALKDLDKDFKAVDPSNQALYTYIEFQCYHFLGDQTKAANAYDSLVTANAMSFVKKANFVLK